MFQKIKKLCVLLLVFMVVCCTACSAGKEAMDGETGNADNDVVMRDGVAEKPDEVSGYKVLKGKIRGVDSLAKPEIYFPSGSDYKKLKNETKEEDGIWEDKEENYLLIEPGRVMYATKEFYDTFESLLEDAKGFRDDLDEILEQGSVWGISKDKAVDTVQRIVEQNKISVKETKAYSLTKDNLTKLSKLFMPDQEYAEYIKDPDNEPMKRVFAEQDEGWLVVMSVCAGENALYPKEYEYGEQCYPGSQIRAIVNKNGLVTFQADGIYDVDTDDSEKIKVLSSGQAQEILNQKFRNKISSHKPECKEMKESFLAVNDGKGSTVKFIPVSIFQIEQKHDDDKGDQKRQFTEQRVLILDRENGKWIE